MNKSGMARRAMLRAVAAVVMGAAMLLPPVAASAHAVADHHLVADNDAAAGTDAVAPLDAGCMHGGAVPASGNRLHCHLASLPSMAVGAKQSPDHDQTAAPAPLMPVFTVQARPVVAKPASLVRIAAPPVYILFGNFRS